MLYGHPVEKLCTYQYSLVTLVPGLLQNLDDCGSPPLASRAGRLEKPTELKTSDPKSMMKFVGLPLDLFGQVSRRLFIVRRCAGGGGLGWWERK